MSARTRITLVGLGRTGLSLGLALKQFVKDIEIIAHDRDRDAAKIAVTLKAADKEEWNLLKACEGAALVLIAIPQDGVALTLKAIAPDLAPGAMVATLGGAIAANLALARQFLQDDIAFVAGALVLNPVRVTPGAPPAAADLKDAVWSLDARGTEEQIGSFSGLVETLGAHPVFVDPAERDGMALSIDTLPPLLQSLLMLTVSNDGAWRERGWTAGSAFADATARADGAPALATALLANKEVSAHWLNEFMRQAILLRDAINAGDAAAVEAQLADARARREAWLNAWARGRDAGGARADVPRRSFAGLFMGDRLADALGKRKKLR